MRVRTEWADGTPSGRDISEWIDNPRVLMLHVIKHRLLEIGAYSASVWRRLELTEPEVLKEIVGAQLEEPILEGMGRR